MARVIYAMLAAAEAQRGTVLLWAPFALSVGIGGYFALDREPGWTGPLGLLGVACGVLIVTRALHVTRSIGVLLVLVALGLVLAKAQTERIAAPVLTKITYGPVSGRLVGLDRSASNRPRLMLDQVVLPGIAPEATPRRVRIVLPRAPHAEVLAPGARVMVRARITPPPPPVEPEGFDFRRHAWFMGLGGIGSASGPVVLAEPYEGPPSDLWLFALRRAVAEQIMARMPSRSAGFAAAILTGDRYGIDPADLEDLRASNLAHLLAISGLHMGLLTGAVFFVVRLGLALVPVVSLRLPTKKLAALAALVAGLGYLMLSGASIATQRAFVMAAVVLLAILLDRPALTLRAVAVAALLILAWRPFVLLSAGFQMSFAATTALIAVYMSLSRMPGWTRIGGIGGAVLRFVIGLCLTSFVAGLATAPIAAFHFNRIPNYGLLANILAVPAMGLLVMPAALLTLVLIPFGAEWMGFALMDIGIRHILDVAHWVASMDGAVRPVRAAPIGILILLAAGGWALAVLRGPPRVLGSLCICASLAFWSVAERPWLLVGPEGKLVGVMGETGRVLNRPRGAGFAARVWLENDGDPVVQKTAAARQEGEGEAGRNEYEVIWTKTGALEPGQCTPQIIVISAETRSQPTGGCLYFDPSILTRVGSVAFVKGRESPLTTVQATGTRPWTTSE